MKKNKLKNFKISKFLLILFYKYFFLKDYKNFAFSKETSSAIFIIFYYFIFFIILLKFLN
jgi:hypothetical protein